MLLAVPGSELWDALPRALGGTHVLAPYPDRAGAEPAASGLPLPDVEDAALVVATSGSTGRPKRVVLTRSALRASAEATHARLGGPGTWTCVLPPHYVAGAMTLVRSWFAGTRPVIAAAVPPVSAPGRHYLSLVPTQLVRAMAEGRTREALAGYDAILVGGAALAGDVRDAAAAAGLRVVSTYGMSETCGGCVYDGQPLDGVRVDVEDGRLVVSGAVVFSGYLGEPELTAQALRQGPSGRSFLSRDRGRVEDGLLTVTGRIDDVVVTGGVNVDLARLGRLAEAEFGPVEAGGVLVLGVPDTEWGTRIVAATTGTWELAEVRRRLARHVSPEALPKELRRVADWPRTESGKIDARELASAWR